MFAPETLGEGVPVEAWYLAKHFLSAWSEWHGVKERYYVYFGIEPNKKWEDLDRKCTKLARSLMANPSLAIHLDESRRPPLFSDETSKCARLLYHATLDSVQFETFVVMSDLLRGDGRLRNEYTLAPTDAHEVRRAIDVERAQEQRERFRDSRKRIAALWKLASSEVRRESREYVMNCRHATLDYSWMFTQAQSYLLHDTDAFPSHIGNGTMNDALNASLKRLNLPADLEEIATRVVSRLAGQIAEIGFDNLVDDLTSSDSIGNVGNLVGASGVALIPGKGNGACCKTVLAVARGDKKQSRGGFPKIMQQLREYLYRCKEVARLAIVVTDHWNPTMLAEHIGDLRAQSDNGVRFLFLLVPRPSQSITLLDIDFDVDPA